MVEVSMSSWRRVWLDSNSSRQTCLGSLALTFMRVRPLSELAQDLLRHSVRSSLLLQPLAQLAVTGQRFLGPLPRHLGNDLGGLVFEPLLGLGAGVAGGLEVFP